MKLPCNVILDLLPLYHDQVCSDETKALVEEHLLSCESCKEVLKSMGNELPIPKQDIESVEILKNIKKELRTKEFKWLIFAVFVLILVISLHNLLAYTLFPVASSKTSISNMSELSDGTIGFHLDVNSYRGLGNFNYEVSEDGSTLYIIPVSGIFPVWEHSNISSANIYYNPENNCVIPYPGSDFWGNNIKKVYLGSPKEPTLIWEEGMDIDLPAADKIMETEYEVIYADALSDYEELQ